MFYLWPITNYNPTFMRKETRNLILVAVYWAFVVVLFLLDVISTNLFYIALICGLLGDVVVLTRDNVKLRKENQKLKAAASQPDS